MTVPAHEIVAGRVPLHARLVFPLAIAAGVLVALLVFTQRIALGFDFTAALGPPMLYPPPLLLHIATGVSLVATVLYAHRLCPILPFVVALPLTVIYGFLLIGPVYPPLEGFRWTPILLRHSVGWWAVLGAIPWALLAGGSIILCGFIVGKMLRRRYDPARYAHGSARYATYDDLKRAGLLEPGGVFLGMFPHRGRLHPITDNSQHHTLFVMPSGAGKSAGHIIPSLLTRTESAFVLDPKGELYDATARWRRAHGHRCIRLAPMEALKHDVERWNPLQEIEPGADDVGTIALLAEALIVVEGSRDTHWNESARALFRCLALHSLYTGKPPSMGHIRAMAHHEDGLEGVLQGILDTEHDPTHRFGWRDPETHQPTRTHPQVALQAPGVLNTPEGEAGSIASTLRRSLALWGDEAILRATAASDFTLNLFNRDEPVTLYCVVPYSDLHTLAPWIRILLASLMRRITAYRNVENAPPLDLYLDEFASLGRVKIIHEILSFLRGYGVRAHIVIQSYEDLARLYGEGENISNCQIHVAAATQSRTSRRFISELGGEATVRWDRRSQSGGAGQVVLSRENWTPTEVSRPLITQGEVGMLQPDEILIAKAGMPMIRARKRFYFEDRVLAGRAGVGTPNRHPAGAGGFAAACMTSGTCSFRRGCG